jgi:hexosaminidase
MSKPILAPAPRSLTSLSGTFPVAYWLEELLQGFTLESVREDSRYPLGFSVALAPDQFAGSESYRLEIEPQGIRLTGSDPRGVFYGAMTLRQLVRQKDSRGRIPCLRIQDRPDFPNRGVMLDVSRNRVPTMETILRLVDVWAELKLNQLQLYTEHTFAYPQARVVWENASPFTGEEVEELDRYCRSRGIELVPNQNSVGHLERWLVHPEYQHLAESVSGCVDSWGNRRPYPFGLYPGAPASLEFLRGLYEELLPHFQSRQFNVGCDEVYDLGQGRSRAECRSRGVGRVYLDFLLSIHAELARRGYRMQFWGDIVLRYPELIPELPRDVVALSWGYEADHPYPEQCRRFAEAGLEYYVCPGTAAWNSIGGRWPNAQANLAAATASGLDFGASGMLIADWGDNGHWQQLPISLPGYFYGASLSWCGASNAALDVAAALSIHFFRDPTGRAAQALLELGGAYQKTEIRVFNATVFHALFFDADNQANARAVAQLTLPGLAAADEAVRGALRLLGRAATTAGDGELLIEELRFTAAHLLHACALGRARLEASGLEVAKAASRVRQALALDMESLIERYRALWLRRSRPGGLEESAGRLERWLALYRGDEASEG